MGMARTFQNLALFKGMSVIDNIMTGRNLKMKCNLLQHALHWGPAQREETRAPRVKVEDVIDFLEIQAYPQDARRAGCPTACKSAWSWAVPWPWSPRCCCWTSPWPA